MKHSRRFWRGLFFFLLIAALCSGLALPAGSIPARAAPQMQALGRIVISQVYGGGGNSGAPYLNDYVELYNPSNSAVSVNGWSIQYASATSTSWQVTPLTNFSIAGGQYYLVQLDAGTSGGNPLPTPDATGTTNMAAGAGKVALVNSTTVLSGSGCPFGASTVDFVGYGTTADCYEGSGRAPAPSSTAAVLRNGNGCIDTDNNSADFVTGGPTPRNSASPAAPCTTIIDVTSSTVDGVYSTGTVIDIAVTFSGIVNVVSGTPTLMLETGTTDRPATYVSGTGSATLNFQYIVVLGDSTRDLDYVATNSLTGATITDSTGGSASLKLPKPGDPGSLGANQDIAIDNGQPPTVTVEQASGQADPANVTPVNFTVLFSEPIDVASFTPSDITQNGSANPVTWTITNSGDDMRFTLAATSVTQNNVTLVPSIVANQVTDLIGTGNLDSTSTDNSVTFVDNTSPTVTVNQAVGQADPTSTLPITFTVVFSEPINASTFIASDITQPAGTATGITWTITDSGDHSNFTLQATAVTGAGTLVPVIAAGAVTDVFGNANAASTSADNTVTFTPAQVVLINEVAWGGTIADSNDEWIELYNPSKTATVDLTNWVLKSNENTPTPNITLSGTIPPDSYLVFARNPGTFAAQPAVSYTVESSINLNNNGEILSLIDSSGKTVDTANSDGGSWPAGTASTGSPTYATMERVTYANQWVTYGGTIPVAYDRGSPTVPNGNAIRGTPGRPNWISGATITTITADTPDPSVINQNVTVVVSVIGGPSTPTGSVSITGANTNCTITLSNGTGSCTAVFTSAGSKTLTATYSGSSAGHAPSTDTESHSVTSTPTTPRPPTATPRPTLAPPPPLIGINEFVPRPGHDWNNDGVINVGDEYIELINHGVIDVNLSSYSLDDEVNIGSTPYTLPSITLKPGERYVFYGNQTGLLLSDGGDGVRLLRVGQLVDAYNYSVVRFPDQSYCRLPDNGGLDDWNQNCFPTPGLQNSLSASSVNPPTSGEAGNLCPISDTLPTAFVLAECLPFGNNIWNAAYWDRFGWFNEQNLPESSGKWSVFVD